MSYEYTMRPQQNAMGLWQWALPATAAAAAVALYTRQASARPPAMSVARGEIGPLPVRYPSDLHFSCAERQGRPCSDAQVADICYNMAPGQWHDICTRRLLSLEDQCRLMRGAPCNLQQQAAYCSELLSPQQPPACNTVMQQALAAQAQQQRERTTLILGEAQRVPMVPAWEMVTPAMKGMGWTRPPGRSGCSQITGGEQICFRTTEVDGRPPEQDFARSRGCVQMQQPCETQPYGNPGALWCCPAGWETHTQETLSATLRNPWLWLGMAGVGVSLWLGWKIIEGD